ncbi:hypothetical protein MKW94_030032 [Papaver nudicaule]|uniref:Homeobox domain-containing protein n=1 Tax=Papaver nudicaule TaxID=74823 RepID=A0AA42AWG1_PAPNU|nr:hypothetical protein [Papaver nudicaule]
MEEEPCELHHEEENALPENKQKRRFKTPAQLEALENFYTEHTYPNETMKADFAKKVGLSEKQVSGWFCHRRLKDKRLLKEASANGKQDLSSGVIQDRGSGLKQDSCSSNKQGSYRCFDPKEVESRRFDAPDYTTPDRPYSKMGVRMPAGNYNTTENTSSGSSTSQEQLFHHKGGRGTLRENLRYPNRSSNSMLMSEGVKNNGKALVSGYLHLQDEIENAAIISVKKQLGRLFCEDGPPLGIEFQPLPPGAFDSPVRNQINDTYKMADTMRQNSHGTKGRKESRIETRYPKYHHEKYTQGSYPVGEHIKHTKSEYVRRERTTYPSLGNPFFNSDRKHAPEGNPTMDENMPESSEDEPPMINSNNNFRRSKYGVEGMVSHNPGNPRFRPSFSKSFNSGEPSDPQLHKYDYSRAHMPKRKEYLEVKSLNLVNQNREAFDSMDGEANVHRRMKDYGNHVRVKKSLKNEMKAGRRVRADFPSRALGSTELLPCRNRTKEHIGDIQTSFYEEAAAATSSSMD